jgi:predicted ester cyclase
MTTHIQLTAERIPLEVLNSGKFGLIDELLTTDFIDHSPQPGVAPTREGLKQSLMALRTAFPDVRYSIEGSVACGDEIVHRLQATGTMTGEFMGVAPTGQSATWTEIHIGRGVNGRLTEHWSVIDQLGMLVQLGIVPAPGRMPVTV